MKTAIILLASLLVASGAAAFAPASQQKTSGTTLSAKAKAKSAGKPFENELGVQEPLGFWDPLGLVADGDQEKFDRLRYVELKHGRICMLGVVGYLVTEAGIRLPGQISTSENLAFADIPSGWAGSTTVPLAGALQILAFVGLLEVAGWKQAEGSFPGDFSASPFPVGWIADYDEETKLKKRAIELNQGRAAQMGMLALMVHDKLGVSILPPH
jgi:hypothetical protein